jgi:hypothetical protein
LRLYDDDRPISDSSKDRFKKKEGETQQQQSNDSAVEQKTDNNGGGIDVEKDEPMDDADSDGAEAESSDVEPELAALVNGLAKE